MIEGNLVEEKFSPALRDFVALAREKLYREPQGDLFAHAREFSRGDHMLNPDFTDRIGDNAPRPAAVLVPIVAHEAPTVLLTQRSKDLSTHAGQVAFPGGRIDPGDASPLAAALREADEEIDLEGRRTEYASLTAHCINVGKIQLSKVGGDVEQVLRTIRILATV